METQTLNDTLHAEALKGALNEAEHAAVDAPLVRALERIAAQIGAHADARAVFASPVTHEGVTVIPVASVFAGFGAGGAQDGATSSGAGGGGGFRTLPVGFIEIDRNGARFRRIDNTIDSWFGVAAVALDLARRGSSWLSAVRARRRAG